MVTMRIRWIYMIRPVWSGMGSLGEVGEALRTGDGSPVPKHRHQQYGAGEDEATCNCSGFLSFCLGKSWKKPREVRLASSPWDKNTWHQICHISHMNITSSYVRSLHHVSSAQGTSWICTWSGGNPCCSLAWQDIVTYCGRWVNDPHLWNSQRCVDCPNMTIYQMYHGLSPIYLLNLLNLLFFNRPNSWICRFMTWDGSCLDTWLLEKKAEEHGHHRFGWRTAGTKGWEAQR